MQIHPLNFYALQHPQEIAFVVLKMRNAGCCDFGLQFHFNNSKRINNELPLIFSPCSQQWQKRQTSSILCLIVKALFTHSFSFFLWFISLHHPPKIGRNLYCVRGCRNKKKYLVQEVVINGVFVSSNSPIQISICNPIGGTLKSFGVCTVSWRFSSSNLLISLWDEICGIECLSWCLVEFVELILMPKITLEIFLHELNPFLRR